ncbi:MAG: helix-hairpin-helix domain-containing protein, partial [Burkholderiales bacterium]
LTPPIKGNRVMGIDPGIRTGTKCAALDETGKFLGYFIINQEHNFEAGKEAVAKAVKEYGIQVIAVGNGTGSSEVCKLVSEAIQEKQLEVQFTVVDEDGASVYSASEIAREEFPELDLTIRGAISIGRRLQDPLAELVKIDPKSIGVGLYQHDVNQAKLSQSLTNVVEDCVNAVGVDVNTASIPLLTHVSGLNSIIASNIVNYRNQNGKFTNREQLKQVSRLGDKTFEQCAGFLRIIDGNNVLDQSAVHPESYPLVEEIAAKLATPVNQLLNNQSLLKQIKPSELVTASYGLPTIIDVIKELEKPGRDPRGEFKTAQFKDGINTINDLIIGMELEGVVTNVTNFGAFVDIGVHQDGLVHISEITNQYIANPSEVLKTGQIVKIRVLEIDKKRKRIALTMKGLNQITALKGSTKPKPARRATETPQGALADAFNKLKLR